MNDRKLLKLLVIIATVADVILYFNLGESVISSTLAFVYITLASLVIIGIGLNTKWSPPVLLMLIVIDLVWSLVLNSSGMVDPFISPVRLLVVFILLGLGLKYVDLPDMTHSTLWRMAKLFLIVIFGFLVAMSIYSVFFN